LPSIVKSAARERECANIGRASAAHGSARSQSDPSVVILTPVATTVVTAGQTAAVDVALGAIQGQVTSTLPSGCTPGVYLYSGNVTAPED
jgi:hypothetical protein